jgi:hypothetical protein
MLAQERLDGLIVATPHVDHAGPASQGWRRCHVLVETPMATATPHARAIAAAAERAGREVLVPAGLNFTRFSAGPPGGCGTGGSERSGTWPARWARPLTTSWRVDHGRDRGSRGPAAALDLGRPAPRRGLRLGAAVARAGWVAHVTGEGWACMACLDVKSLTGVDYYDAGMDVSRAARRCRCRGPPPCPSMSGCIWMCGSTGRRE